MGTMRNPKNNTKSARGAKKGFRVRSNGSASHFQVGRRYHHRRRILPRDQLANSNQCHLILGTNQLVFFIRWSLLVFFGNIVL